MKFLEEGSASTAFTAGLRAALASAMIGLAWLSPGVGWSAPVAHQSRILGFDLEHPDASALTDLEAAAAGAGMRCRTVTHPVHGRHAPPPTSGLQCSAPESPSFFEAFVSPDAEQVLIKIYAMSASTPHGEIDPRIDRVLRAYKRTLIEVRNFRSLQECVTSDIESC